MINPRTNDCCKSIDRPCLLGSCQRLKASSTIIAQAQHLSCVHHRDVISSSQFRSPFILVSSLTGCSSCFVGKRQRSSTFECQARTRQLLIRSGSRRHGARSAQPPSHIFFFPPLQFLLLYCTSTCMFETRVVPSRSLSPAVARLLLLYQWLIGAPSVSTRRSYVLLRF